VIGWGANRPERRGWGVFSLDVCQWAARPWLCARGAATLLLLALLLSPSQAAPPADYAVEAAYLTKLAPFVEWPADTFPGPTSPLVICVVGYDPFGVLLDHLAGNQPAGSRPAIVRRLRFAARDSACHVMFIGGSDTQSVAHALEIVQKRPILTVTDDEIEQDARGIIHFVVEGSRVRFDIDDASAAESGLTVSSKLLGLARHVRPRPQPR
jgi:YfiR/HmsC-like